MLNEPTTAVGLRDRLLLVHSISNIGELSEHAMVLLAEHAKERHYQAGEIVQSEGEPITNAHFVVRGEIEVSRKGVVMVIADDGGTVGMVSLLARDPWGVKAVALKPSHTLAIPTEVILDVYEESRSFLRTALKYSALGLLQKRGNLPVPADYDPGDDLGNYSDRPPTLVEQIIEMRSNPMFADRNLEAVVDLARIGEWVTAEPGDRLWEIGDQATHHIWLKYGRIRCATADGQSVAVAGDYTLGVMDALGRSERTYSAVAETELQGVRVDIRGMLVVLETHHDLAMDLLANLSNRLLPRGPDGT